MIILIPIIVSLLGILALWFLFQNHEPPVDRIIAPPPALPRFDDLVFVGILKKVHGFWFVNWPVTNFDIAVEGRIIKCAGIWEMADARSPIRNMKEGDPISVIGRFQRDESSNDPYFRVISLKTKIV